MNLKQGEIPAFFVSRRGRRELHAEDAKSFTQRAQRVSRKGRRKFHAKGAESFTRRAQRVSRVGRKELLRNTGVQIIIKGFLGFENIKGVVQKLF